MATAVPIMVAEITKRAKGGRGLPPAPSPKDSAEGDDEASYDKIKRSAVEDLFAAIKDDDVDAALIALDHFVEACIDEEGSETPKQESDEDVGEKG